MLEISIYLNIAYVIDNVHPFLIFLQYLISHLNETEIFHNIWSAQVEIFGPESSGKTTLALHAVAEAHKQGGLQPL